MTLCSKSCLVSALLLGLTHSGADAENPVVASPLKYLSSCEVDLNADDELDAVFLVETVRGHELIILLRRSRAYEAHSFTVTREQLSCPIGDTVSETASAAGAGRHLKTPGAYVLLRQPEGAARAFVWTSGKFIEIWTRD